MYEDHTTSQADRKYTYCNVRPIIAALPTAIGIEKCRTQECALMFVSSPFCPKTSKCPGHQPSACFRREPWQNTGGLEIEKAFRECVIIALFVKRKRGNRINSGPERFGFVDRPESGARLKRVCYPPDEMQQLATEASSQVVRPGNLRGNCTCEGRCHDVSPVFGSFGSIRISTASVSIPEILTQSIRIYTVRGTEPPSCPQCIPSRDFCFPV